MIEILIFLISYWIKKGSCLNICERSEWSGSALTVAGSPVGDYGSTPSLLHYPTDVYVDNNNRIYVLDSNNYRVQLFLPNIFDGITIIDGSYGTELNQFKSSRFY